MTDLFTFSKSQFFHLRVKIVCLKFVWKCFHFQFILNACQGMTLHGNKLLQSFNEKYLLANLLENNICENEIFKQETKRSCWNLATKIIQNEQILLKYSAFGSKNLKIKNFSWRLSIAFFNFFSTASSRDAWSRRKKTVTSHLFSFFHLCLAKPTPSQFSDKGLFHYPSWYCFKSD